MVARSSSPSLSIPSATVPIGSLGRRRRRRQALFIAVCLLPTFVLIGTFNYYPLASALYHSLFTWDGFSAPKYVGLQNFTNLWSDPAIQASIKNMGILALSAVLITVTTPLLAAELVLAVRNARLLKLYRALLVVPIVVPQLVTLLLWSFMYDPSLGVINSLLSEVGLGALQPQWLGDPSIALYAIIGIGFPWVAGLNFLLYLAALQNIPAEIHDASQLDGAVGWRRAIMIDLPQITVQIRLLITLALITVMQTFTSVWVLTQGGPGYATTVPGVVLYQQAFQFSNFGYASAIGAMIFLVTLAMTVLSNGLGRLLSRGGV